MPKNTKDIEMEKAAINKTNQINEKISSKLSQLDPEKLKSIDTRLEETKLEAVKDFWSGESSNGKWSVIREERYLQAAKEKAQAVIDQVPSIASKEEIKDLKKLISSAEKIEDKSFNYFTQDSSNVTSDVEPMDFGWGEE